MLLCNLAVLLAERKMRISTVSKETGISRTTLTSLANNHSQGIQLDTLNKLCMYLQCPPEKFFVYLPYDYAVGLSKQSDGVYTLEFTLSFKGKYTKVSMIAYVDFDEAGGMDIELALFGDDPGEDKFIKSYIGGLPVVFKKDLENMIIGTALYEIPHRDVSSAVVLWPAEWD